MPRAEASRSDDELVAQFRTGAIERSKCWYLPEGNRIYDQQMAPAYEALAARGDASRRKLLALVSDPSRDVRLDAAICTYDLDPHRCREALRDALKDQSLRIVATVMLLSKDPEFAA